MYFIVCGVWIAIVASIADVFVEDVARGNWFDNYIKLTTAKEQIKEGSKWLVGEISGQLEKRGQTIEQMTITAQDLLELVTQMQSKKISGTIAKEVINTIFDQGGTAKSIIESKGLTQITDISFVADIAKKVIEENAKVVADITKNPNAIKFLVGQIMRQTQGKVNPHTAEEELKKLLQIS